MPLLGCSFLLLWIVSSGSAIACSNGECQLLEECSADSDCQVGLYCFSCEAGFSGKRCVRSILTDQFKIVNGVRVLMLDTYEFEEWPGLASDGDDGMEAGKCVNRAESASLNDSTKSLILLNYFPSIPSADNACVDNSGGLTDILNTCYGAASNRWANFVAVDFYKRSESGGAFQATDMLNGRFLCGCDDVHSCVAGSTSGSCSP